MWIGSWKARRDKLPGIKWTFAPIKILGIYVTYDKNKLLEHNFGKKIKVQDLKKTLNLWKMRSLSLMGKVLILKALAMSKITYACNFITPNEDIMKDINSILFNFLWDGKPDKIKRRTVIADYKEGGIRMPDIKSRIKTIKIMWIKRLKMPQKAAWKDIFNASTSTFGGTDFLLRCDFKVEKLHGNLLPYHRELLDKIHGRH